MKASAENSGEQQLVTSMRGRPFPKGRSGNPGGRPKVVAELRALARTHAPEAIEELARLAVKAKSETARVAAIRELLDRGYGKATQSLEMGEPDGGPMVTNIEVSFVKSRYDGMKTMDGSGGNGHNSQSASS